MRHCSCRFAEPGPRLELKKAGRRLSSAQLRKGHSASKTRKRAYGAASAFGCRLRPALAPSHFRTPHEARLTAIRISALPDTGISIPQDLMLMNEKIFPFPGRSAARSPCGAVRCRAGAVQTTVFIRSRCCGNAPLDKAAWFAQGLTSSLSHFHCNEPHFYL
jgi:hypothetical protein